MRIAYDYQTFTIQAYGGISRYYIKLAEELIKINQEIRIFAPYHCNQLVDSLQHSIVSGRKVASKDFSKPKALSMMLLNLALSKNAIRRWNPSIVHETYYGLLRSGPKKYPVVITVHDMIHEKFPQYFSSADPIRFLKRLAIARADHIICVSESTRRDLVQLYPSVEGKLSVIRLGHIANNLDRPSLVNTKPYLLYVGSRNGHKNFVNLLYSFAASKRLRADFNLVAFGGGGFNNKELNEMNSLKFRPMQIMQTEGDDKLLSAYYKGAAAFIYPSFYEGFGLPPLEAMANNCPVVSSNSSSMPEVIGEAGEYFDPNSMIEIARSIERVVFSQSRREELISLGKERLKLFTWSSCATSTLQVYNRLLSK